ncbi:MAG: hypothetical protein HY770_04910 [Chitinivibrionia bacterium]|nr:hypothetical protein [Chitinivibrionia bacterium]
MKERMVSWEAWVTDAETLLKVAQDYSSNVHVIGLSLGATISILLSSMHKMRTLVLLSPALYERIKPKERFYAIGRKALPSLFFRLAGWHGEILQAMESVRNNPKQIEHPVLVLQAMDDAYLSTKGLKWLRSCATNPQSEVVLLPHGSHSLTRGESKDEVFQRIFNFIQKF